MADTLPTSRDLRALAKAQADTAKANRDIAAALNRLADEQRTANRIAAVSTSGPGGGLEDPIALNAKTQKRLLIEALDALREARDQEEA